MDLKQAMRTFPDYPAKGIMFRDITTVLKNPSALNHALNQMAAQLEGLDFDIIVAPESRGFIFGAPLAARFGKGFVPARKKGKLPGPTAAKEYTLEYGTDTIEIHTDAVEAGQKVVIVDDLLATGGTAKCICDIVAELGGTVVRSVFLIELEELGGRDMLGDIGIRAVLTY
ncbi:MAG: adenine phosphoribosyltransferase [Defluviitaleaceae bacterium]|nr:adenine phosphoribosyltransferase [Defluviitaleaceae bacterium]